MMRAACRALDADGGALHHRNDPAAQHQLALGAPAIDLATSLERFAHARQHTRDARASSGVLPLLGVVAGRSRLSVAAYADVGFHFGAGEAIGRPLAFTSVSAVAPGVAAA